MSEGCDPGDFLPGIYTTNGAVPTYVYQNYLEIQPLQIDLEEQNNGQIDDENNEKIFCVMMVLLPM